MVIVGCLLLIVDPIRHVLLDHDGVFFKPSFLSMYNTNGTLSPTGRTCQIFTVLGLVNLFMGISWFMNLDQVLYKLCGIPKEK